jgi:simple sugar transport system permease protein
MDEISIFIANVLSRMFIAGTPLLLGTIGEIYAERSGILNLGIEGMMAVGAVTGFAITHITGNPLLGILTAGIVGSSLSLIHAFITISMKANQVVSGLALTMFGIGLSGLLGKSFIGTPLINKFNEIEIPLLNKLPILGTSLFTKDPIIYLSIFISFLMWFILFKTRWGIEIRSVGENPIAANAMGINVYKVQYICVLVGGFFSGLAGAYLSIIYITTWIEGMTGGRGWIIIALTIFANWNPLKAIISAYIFGGVFILQYLLQPLGISPNLIMMFPYLATILILFIGSNKAMKRRIGAPAYLGVTFVKNK